MSVTLKDKSAKAPGLVQFQVKGTFGAYTASSAVMPALVFPDAGVCFAAQFPGPAPQPACTLNARGTTLTCK